MRRKIGLSIICLLILIFGYNIIAQIYSTLKSGDTLQQATESLNQVEKKNKELQKKLTEVKSQHFIEQEARDKLGLSKPGETIVIIPDNKLEQILGLSKKKDEEVRLPNWQGWLKLFFP